jgi:hypothetical protein
LRIDYNCLPRLGFREQREVEIWWSWEHEGIWPVVAIDRPKLEVLPAIAGGHGDEQSEPDDAGLEPRHQAVTAVALGSGRGARNSTRTTSKKNSLRECQPMCLTRVETLGFLSTSLGVASRGDDQPIPHEKIGLKKQQFGRGEQDAGREYLYGSRA